MNKKNKKTMQDIVSKGPKLVKGKTYASEFGGAGKGDAPRPIDKKKFDENYNSIFRASDKAGCKKKCNCKREDGKSKK
tara:strand:+ start:753 stop:986 length:234 start_codon:yes stop_codon:yes gene_type:complete